MKLGTLLVISAPSGAGKTSLVKALLEQNPFKDLIQSVVTYTTRAPRAGDINGCDYHFISSQEFECLISKGFFAEWSNAYGNYYGTPVSIITDAFQGLSQIIIVDRSGAQRLAKAHPKAVLIWITPPSLTILRERLERRGTETEVQIERRLLIAQGEIEAELLTPLYNHYIVNDLFENSLDFLKKIVSFELKL